MSAPNYSKIAALAEYRMVPIGINIVRRAGIQSWSERHIAFHDEEITLSIKAIREALDEIEAELAKGQTDD
jgi:hypothetical protein